MSEELEIIKKEIISALNENNCRERAVKIYQTYKETQRIIDNLVYEHDRIVDFIRISKEDGAYNVGGGTEDFYNAEKDVIKKQIIEARKEVLSFVERSLSLLKIDLTQAKRENDLFAEQGSVMEILESSTESINRFVELDNRIFLLSSVVDMLEISPYASVLNSLKQKNDVDDEPKI